jgi:hypothetical protein
LWVDQGLSYYKTSNRNSKTYISERHNGTLTAKRRKTVLHNISPITTTWYDWSVSSYVIVELPLDNFATDYTHLQA